MWRGILRVCVSSVLWLAASMGLAAEPYKFTDAERNHWAFQPVGRPSVPLVASTRGSQPQNEVDAFLLAALMKDGTSLSVPADKLTLLRRVKFDLVGLPPTPEEAAEFLADESPEAYEQLVERLLASPHYGETWGRMWLDVVRFAETAGFNADPARPLAYKYRDYVIRAFNRDLPYDRFLQEQLAGDELFPDDAESLAATGYCRMWPDESNASNIHLARQSALDDLTGNLGAAVLGLSIGCAQCHDHKFDPILQTDFYQLQAFFSGIVLEDKLPVGKHEQLVEYRRQQQQWLDETADLRHELHEIEKAARIKMAGDKRMKFPADVLAAIDCPPEERSTMQRQLTFWSERQMEYKNDDLPKHIAEDKKARREELIALLAEAKKKQPKPPREANVMAVGELSTTPPKTHLLETGSYDKPLEELAPHYPAILRREATLNPLAITPPNERSSGRRSELARWLTSADHPLTHRVWVNRVWQGHFGKGLIDNANDFGVQTPTPTHLELFDWLTSEFIASGYSTKHLHRLIVLSATYRQSGAVNNGTERTNGKLAGPTSSSPSTLNHQPSTYSSFPRQRLSSERIRDAWLVASGNFNDTMFGTGVRPELPPNFGGAGAWKVSDPPDRVRRSVYIYAKRNLPYPLMAAFDFPDMHEACGCRTKTTIAPQALMLLNSGLIVNAAKQLASRSKEEAGSADPAARIGRAWQIAFGRSPGDREVQAAMKFTAAQQQIIADSDTTRTGESVHTPTDSDTEAAFLDLCHALLNANEFLFVE
ncbi:MAG: DUF1549 and DUF1553 domain-containing protein [Planctomycetota bacterium]